MSSSKNDFIIALKYQNNIPSAPSGPYLKNVGMYHDFSSCGEYRTSTLEKSYIWQPHFGPDIGISLDLVDQDLILSQDKEVTKLDQSDLKFLSNVTEKGRGKVRELDQSTKPWWLRNTTYIENNVFNQLRKIKNEGIDIQQKKLKIKNKKDPYSIEGINDSFQVIHETIKNLHKKKKIKQVINILPFSVDHDGTFFGSKQHSLIRFDEDPQILSSKVTIVEEKEKNIENQDEKPLKRRKIDYGIITNLRQSEEKVEFKKALLPEVSFVAPLEDNEQENVEVIDTKEQNDDGTFYDWVTDYKMDIQASDVKDSFLFLLNGLNESSNNEKEGIIQGKDAYFFPLVARIEMRKIPYEDARPHECYVLPEKLL